MIQVLGGALFGWLAATLMLIGVVLSGALLQQMFPRSLKARLGAGMLLMVLGALPGASIAVLMLLMAAGIMSQGSPLMAASFAVAGLGTIVVGIYFWHRKTPPYPASPAPFLVEPEPTPVLPPPLPLPLPHGTFPSARRVPPALPEEETIHFGDPDPSFTAAELQAMEEECDAAEKLERLRDRLVAPKN